MFVVKISKLCKNQNYWAIPAYKTLFQRVFFGQNWKRGPFLAICLAVLPSYFCKYGPNHLKFSEQLAFNRFYVISKNYEHSTFFAFVTVLQRDFVLKFLLPEDEVIVKNRWNSYPMGFSRRFQKFNWFFCGTLLIYLNWHPILIVLKLLFLSERCWHEWPPSPGKMTIFSYFGLFTTKQRKFGQCSFKSF